MRCPFVFGEIDALATWGGGLDREDRRLEKGWWCGAGREEREAGHSV